MKVECVCVMGENTMKIEGEYGRGSTNKKE
jgi:hypothetical protein